MPDANRKKTWSINPEAFQNLLNRLDEGENSDGQRYLEIRARLVNYFDRKNCLNSDELADETLNRVARRLEEEGKIESETPLKFCYITAKFVFLESLRNKNNQSVPLDETVINRRFNDLSEEKAVKEKMLVCLENCTNKLEPENRELIFGYYNGEERVKIENRRRLAEKYNV